MTAGCDIGGTTERQARPSGGGRVVPMGSRGGSAGEARWVLTTVTQSVNDEAGAPAVLFPLRLVLVTTAPFLGTRRPCRWGGLSTGGLGTR
jgi:hypothetical protein